MSLTGLLARDGFSRANTADIGGSALDGDGTPTAAVGVWVKHPVTPGAIGIDTSDAAPQDGSYDIYSVASIPGLNPVEHAAESILVFPSFDTDPVTTYPACAYIGGGVGAHAGVNPDHFVSGNDDYYRFWFQRPPANAILTIEDTVNGIHMKLYVEVNATATHANIFVDVSGHPSGDHTHYQYAGMGSGAPLFDYCNSMEVTAKTGGFVGGDMSVSCNGSGPGLGLDPPTVWNGLNSPSYTDGGATHDEIDHGNPIVTGGPGGETPYSEVLVREDPTAETNYALGAAFNHVIDPPNVVFQLYSAVASSYTLLRQKDGIADLGLTFAHGAQPALKLEVTAANVLTATWGATVICTFDLTTDLADETAALAPMIASGRPGMTTSADVATHVRIRQFSVYGDCLRYPCEGGDDNPYPYDPPPDAEPPPVYIGVMTLGKWESVLVESIAPEDFGRFGIVQVENRPGTMLFGKWNPLVPDLGDEPPPPNTPEPPFHDPCLLLPPVDHGIIPIVGTAYFGMGNTPPSALGDLFTFTQKAVGAWTASDLTVCEARASKMVVAQGGYDRMMSGGKWNLATAMNFADTELVPRLATLLRPGCFGYSMADDISSASLWGISGGIPKGELVTFIAYLHSVLPGVLIGGRILPSQFTFDPGLDFYTAQYVYERHPASAFRALEQGLAQSRGAYIILSQNYLHGGDGSSGIIIVNNTMRSGHYCMSPAEVIANGDELYTDGSNLAGALGYQFGEPLFMNQAGIVDALTTNRNRIAAL